MQPETAIVGNFIISRHRETVTVSLGWTGSPALLQKTWFGWKAGLNPDEKFADEESADYAFHEAVELMRKIL